MNLHFLALFYVAPVIICI